MTESPSHGTGAIAAETLRSRPPDASQTGRNGLRLWLAFGALLILTSLGIQLHTLWRTYALGGHEWLQADWLINLAAGPIRRGPMGAILLHLAASADVPTLDLVVGLQLGLLLAISGCLLALLVRQTHPAMVLALLSPGFITILWAVDPASGLRKDMFGLLALLVLALPGRWMPRATLSAMLLVAGAWGHEVNLLFLPAWLIAVFLFGPDLSRRTRMAHALPVGLLVALAAAYALSYARLPDAGPVCQALTRQAGLPPTICDGAIAALADPANGTRLVLEVLRESPTSALVPLAFLLATAPLVRLLGMSDTPQRTGALLLAAALPFFLLYPVGFDWGRWLAMQISTAAILVLGLGARGRVVPRRPMLRAEPLIWLSFALVIGISHDPVLIPFLFFRDV